MRFGSPESLAYKFALACISVPSPAVIAASLALDVPPPAESDESPDYLVALRMTLAVWWPALAIRFAVSSVLAVLC